jgi:ABC-2 type transport system ATP-binding protein
LADICNKIGIIERGKLEFDGTVESAIQQVRQQTVFHVAVAGGRNAEAREHLEAHVNVHSVEARDGEEDLRVTLIDGIRDGSFLAELLMQNGFRLKTLKEEEIDLEEVFMRITKGITN